MPAAVPDDTQDPFGLGNWTLFQMVSGWRENAWRNAEALISDLEGNMPARNPYCLDELRKFIDTSPEALLDLQGTFQNNCAPRMEASVTFLQPESHTAQRRARAVQPYA